MNLLVLVEGIERVPFSLRIFCDVTILGTHLEEVLKYQKALRLMILLGEALNPLRTDTDVMDG